MEILYSWEIRERHIRIMLGELEGRHHIRDLVVDGIVVLKWTIKK